MIAGHITFFAIKILPLKYYNTIRPAAEVARYCGISRSTTKNIQHSMIK